MSNAERARDIVGECGLAWHADGERRAKIIQRALDEAGKAGRAEALREVMQREALRWASAYGWAFSRAGFAGESFDPEEKEWLHDAATHAYEKLYGSTLHEASATPPPVRESRED